MTLVITRASIIALLITALPYPAQAADVVQDQKPSTVVTDPVPYSGKAIKISGRASVIDGRTLWFPLSRRKVQLAWVDTCELPQWSFDPRRHGESTIPKPIPCGPLAKAWLKRTIGDAVVDCVGQAHNAEGVFLGRCTVRGRDLALEMLRVGWARVSSPAPQEYLTWQNYAKSARQGMWATYLLDMPEWRRKAVDRTRARRPIADFNLLAERESEISPPFDDARRRPRGTDR